jgi:hypothetical protein
VPAKFLKKFIAQQKKENEKGARANVVEELFYDLNRSRVQIYKMNLVRGIFFGFGSVIGGTIFVAILAGLLSLLVDLPGGVGGFVKYVVDIVRQS